MPYEEVYVLRNKRANTVDVSLRQHDVRQEKLLDEFLELSCLRCYTTSAKSKDLPNNSLDQHCEVWHLESEQQYSVCYINGKTTVLPVAMDKKLMKRNKSMIGKG